MPTPDFFQDTKLNINTQTGTAYTLVLADAGKLVEMNNGSSMTLTVPTNATVPFPVGTHILVSRYGAGALAISAAGGVTLRGDSAVAAQYGTARLIKRGTNEWYVTDETA